MKKIILILAVMLSISANAQIFQGKYWDALLTNAYAGLKYDPKMAHDGLGHDYVNKKVFNWEAEIGWDINNSDRNGIRFSTKVEHNHQIGYLKYNLIAVDWKRVDQILFFNAKNFHSYIGFEIGTIWREDQLHFDTEDSLTAGINGEIQWQLFDVFAIGLSTNVFIAEATLIRDNKPVRWDVMFGVYLKSKR